MYFTSRYKSSVKNLIVIIDISYYNKRNIVRRKFRLINCRWIHVIIVNVVTPEKKKKIGDFMKDLFTSLVYLFDGILLKSHSYITIC